MDQNLRYTVLIVDDYQVELEFLSYALEDNYNVKTASSGEEALEYLESHAVPDIVLLDVNMPGMDGYLTCSNIISTFGDVDIIFVSGHNTTEEVLKGYEAGGIDYIFKPLDIDVLKQKIEVAIANRAKRKQLKNDNKNVTDMMFTAMSYSGELGVILNFQSKCFAINTLEELAQALCQAALEYDLNCCVYVKDATTQQEEFASDTGITSELELKLLREAKALNERFLIVSSRMFVRYNDIIFLAKNIPVDQPEKLGRIKDNLLLLCQSAESRIQSFAKTPAVSGVAHSEQQLDAMKAEVSQIVMNIESTFEYLKEAQAAHQEKSLNIVDELMKEVEDAFFHLGLTEDQERNLLSIISKSVDRSLKHNEEGSQLDSEVTSIIDQLSYLSKIHEMLCSDNAQAAQENAKAILFARQMVGSSQ